MWNSNGSLGAQGSNGPDRITFTLYDQAGQVRQTVRGTGTSWQQVYATYLYSQNGKLQAVADADAVTGLGLSYANALNPSSAAAHQTNYIYDGFDRLVQTIYADGSGDQVTLYDADDNALTKVTRAGQTLNFLYDAVDRVYSKSVPAVSGVSSANTIATTYDGMSRVLRYSYMTVTDDDVNSNRRRRRNKTDMITPPHNCELGLTR
jgi:YD repeat-containing protein